MKVNPLACVLVVLLAIAVQLPAQQPATNATETNLLVWEAVSASGTNANQATTEATNTDQEIITLIRNAAEHGDADAQNNLGWIYFNGYGVSKNVDEAIKWLTKSAENGNLQAEGRLAAHYFFLTRAKTKTSKREFDGIGSARNAGIFWIRQRWH